MSDGVIEIVANELKEVHDLGPLTRLVFAMTTGGGIGSPDKYSSAVVCVVIPTEILPAVKAKLAGAGPPLRAVHGPNGIELVAGGRDVACLGKC